MIIKLSLDFGYKTYLKFILSIIHCLCDKYECSIAKIIAKYSFYLLYYLLQLPDVINCQCLKIE